MAVVVKSAAIPAGESRQISNPGTEDGVFFAVTAPPIT
jgi:mannose-6-phosphate isomerase-like protein (cupin superfamily)